MPAFSTLQIGQQLSKPKVEFTQLWNTR